MFKQLNPTIPVYIKSKEKTGYALAVIDYSQEHDLIWIVALDESGEMWCVPNADIRAVKNYSIGRNFEENLKNISKEENVLPTQENENNSLRENSGEKEKKCKNCGAEYSNDYVCFSYCDPFCFFKKNPQVEILELPDKTEIRNPAKAIFTLKIEKKGNVLSYAALDKQEMGFERANDSLSKNDDEKTEVKCETCGSDFSHGPIDPNLPFCDPWCFFKKYPGIDTMTLANKRGRVFENEELKKRMERIKEEQKIYSDSSKGF